VSQIPVPAETDRAALWLCEVRDSFRKMADEANQKLREYVSDACDNADVSAYIASLVAERDELRQLLAALVEKFDNERRWHNARGGDDYPDSTQIYNARKALSAKEPT
jgi:hypothetical protein